MTLDERKAIIERGVKRILDDWPELANCEIAQLIAEGLFEEWQQEMKN